MTWSVAGVNFAHFHMGDNLRMVEEHPDAEIVGICDENPEEATLGLEDTAEEFDLDDDQVYRDHERCLAERDPDVVITCPVPVEHAHWVEEIVEHGPDVILEKPMAASVEGANRIIRAADRADARVAVNWPIAWYPTHRTTKRLIDEGAIGEVVEVHYYDGNRGGHSFTEVEYTEEGELHFMGDMEGGGPEENVADPDAGVPESERAWWHRPDRGGGSLHDYLGYGTTLGTWFRDGELPIEVSAQTFTPPHLDVETHCIATARYETGLSKFESRWGTFTDPWVDQPQPKCGFEIVGTGGTISCYDYEETVRVQDEENPDGYEVEVDDLESPLTDPVEYVIDCIENDRDIEFGPLNPALCRDAQYIVDAAEASAERGEAVRLSELGE